jgi:hypothetical protein
MPDSMDIATFHELSSSLCVVCPITFESIIDRPAGAGTLVRQPPICKLTRAISAPLLPQVNDPL